MPPHQTGTSSAWDQRLSSTVPFSSTSRSCTRKEGMGTMTSSCTGRPARGESGARVRESSIPGSSFSSLSNWAEPGLGISLALPATELAGEAAEGWAKDSADMMPLQVHLDDRNPDRKN